MENIDQLSTQNSYISDELFLRAHGKTIGVYNTTLEFDGVPCQILDLGGTRSERRKLNRLPNSTFAKLGGIIYVVSLPGYCKVSFEDEKTAGKPALCAYDDITNTHNVRLKWKNPSSVSKA